MKYQSIFITLISTTFAASTSSNNSTQSLDTIISNAKATIAQKVNSHVISSTNNQTPNMIISNDVAQSKVSLGKYSGEFNINNNSYQCIEGSMYCDYSGNGFWTCAEGVWVYRNCGPGTQCIQNGGNLYCGY